MENNEKPPTWHWIAITAVSMVTGIVGFGAVETRMDIKDAKMTAITLTGRVAVIEKANEIQYQNINDRQKEIRGMLEKMEMSMKQVAEALAIHERNSAKAR